MEAGRQALRARGAQALTGIRAARQFRATCAVLQSKKKKKKKFKVHGEEQQQQQQVDMTTGKLPMPDNAMLGLKTVIVASLLYQVSVLYRNYNAQEEAAEEASTTQGHQVDEVDARDALDASAGTS